MKLKNLLLFGFIFLFISCCNQSEQKTVKIGVINSLTGSASPYGKNADNGMSLAVEEINKAGGINGKKLELIVEDDQTNPNVSVNIFNKFSDIYKVPLIIGPLSSSSTMACAPIANDKKIVIISSGAATPNLTLAGDYVFRNRAPGQLEAMEIAEYAYNDLMLKDIIILYINTDYGAGFKDVFKLRFESLGGKISNIDSYVQGQTDFKHLINKFKKYKNEGVYILGVPIEVGNFLKQAYEMNYRKVFLMNNMEDQNLLNIAGKGAEGIYFSISFLDSASGNYRTKVFIENYKRKFQKIPDIFAADAYDAVYISKLAIEMGGYSGESIKNSLYKIKNYDGVTGRLSFDENGDVIKPLVIKTVKDGKFVILE